MNINTFKRGDIVMYDFGENRGSVQNGYRPAVVLQNNDQNENSPTTVIAPTTTARKKQEMFAHVYLGKRFGLRSKSMILLEQLRTVNQSDLGKKVGHIDDQEVINKINSGLKKLLDLRKQGCDIKAIIIEQCGYTKPRRRSFNQRDIMCLCSVCRDAYRHRGFKVLKASKEKDTCDLCNHRMGFDYAVVGLLTR